MTDASARASEPTEIGFDEGGVRITHDMLHLRDCAIPLADVLATEETTMPKSASQIAAAIFGCLLILVAVPSALMCPLALMGIPFAARVLSWAIRDQDTSYALRVHARGRRPLVVHFDERPLGLRVARAITSRMPRGS